MECFVAEYSAEHLRLFAHFLVVSPKHDRCMNKAKQPQRVAVNTRLLLKDRLEGIGIYTHEILRRLCAQNPEIEFHFLFDRPYDPSFLYGPNCIGHVIPPPTRHPFLWDFWLRVSLPLFLRAKQWDAFLSLDGFALPKGILPQIIAIHDLNFEHRPQDLASHVARYYRKRFPVFARDADAVLTVSHFSRQDLLQQYRLPENKVTVAENALPEWTISKEDHAQAADKLFSLTHGEPFFLYVGAIHPRKNLPMLLQAFEQVRQQHSSPVHLIIAGGASRFYLSQWQSALAGTNPQFVHWTGRISEAEKAHWLSASMALVYPSLYEGFGIPLLEAWHAGTAVICSSVTALPEVAGDAALLINPMDQQSLEAALKRILQEPHLRETLKFKGKERLAHYAWERSVASVEKVLHQILHR